MSLTPLSNCIKRAILPSWPTPLPSVLKTFQELQNLPNSAKKGLTGFDWLGLVGFGLVLVGFARFWLVLVCFGFGGSW